MRTLGVLGGLGPAASCYFYDLCIRQCPAALDQDHPDILLYSKASVPDRTAFLMGRSAESPGPALVSGVQVLARAGAERIAVPCGTAHHWYREMQAAVGVPILNMLDLTAQALKSDGVTRAALLATEGSYRSGAFCRALEATGIAPLAPRAAEAAVLMDIIYTIKSGHIPDKEVLEAFAAPLFAQGAQRVILGCTELSLFEGLDKTYIDPLKILAGELLCNSPTSSNTSTPSPRACRTSRPSATTRFN